jgi:hypothetical protein
MQAQHALHAKGDKLHTGYKYNNVFSAFYLIASTEGFLSLYTGVGPTMMRAGVV